MPHKTIRELVEHYYQWKKERTRVSYVERQKIEGEFKL